MNNVDKTLYIPLYGKAYVSKKGVILHDEKAQEIWDAEGFELKGKARSKWLAYYMGMRSAVFDQWLKQQMDLDSGAVIVHIGCGMDRQSSKKSKRDHTHGRCEYVFSDRGAHAIIEAFDKPFSKDNCFDGLLYSFCCKSIKI